MIITEDFLPMIFDFFGSIGTTGVYRKSDVSYNPTTMESTEIVVEYPVNCIVLDLTLQSNGYTLKRGTDIQTGDKQIFVIPPSIVDSSVLPFIIDTAKDKLVVGGTSYNIVTFKQVNTQMGASPFFYEFYCRT